MFSTYPVILKPFVVPPVKKLATPGKCQQVWRWQTLASSSLLEPEMQ